MSFLEAIFQRLKVVAGSPVLREARSGELVAVTGGELLALAAEAREFLHSKRLQKGDRCVLLAPNSNRWVALDLAVMAEGGIAVPLYARQSPDELLVMMRDCEPSMIICGDEALAAATAGRWTEAPPVFLFDQVFPPAHAAAADKLATEPPRPMAQGDAVTIIYTSGTSGEAKGVVITAGNVSFMLERTSHGFDLLMGKEGGTERVFHYPPFCFAASWIALLTYLSRNTIVTISTDLTKLMDEMKLAVPDYFTNVPALLERMRAAIEGQFKKWGGVRETIFEKGKAEWYRRREGRTTLAGAFWLALASIFFRAIRKKISPNLKALICGSAPLSLETQLFFEMLGVAVLQLYGLTETTAICTMDRPREAKPGWVGRAIDGIDMKLGPADEILVRGPNIFAGYWNRLEETNNVLRDGWFQTGDQGEMDEAGNWRITGRIKNLIVLSSGHNVAPEPIEERLQRQIPTAQQVLVVGNGRPHLGAIVTGDVSAGDVELALAAVNPELPHYRRIHSFSIHKEPFTIDNGLLTANGKLKRGAITERLRDEIEALYYAKQT